MTMLPSTDPQLDKLRNGRPPMPLPTRGVEEAQALRCAWRMACRIRVSLR
jgi:hypothetical protein